MSSPGAAAGFVYDEGKAEAIANTLAVALEQLKAGELSSPDQLAGLGLLAARVIAGTGLSRRPGDAVARMVMVLEDELARLGVPRTPARPSG